MGRVKQAEGFDELEAFIASYEPSSHRQLVRTGVILVAELFCPGRAGQHCGRSFGRVQVFPGEGRDRTRPSYHLREDSPYFRLPEGAEGVWPQLGPGVRNPRTGRRLFRKEYLRQRSGPDKEVLVFECGCGWRRRVNPVRLAKHLYENRITEHVLS